MAPITSLKADVSYSNETPLELHIALYDIYNVK